MNISRKPREVPGELILWALVLGVAASLRLLSLNTVPLGTSEAQEALVALRAGRSLPLAGSYTSAVLLVLNSLTFVLFGATDEAARLWPVLAGIGLVISPLLFRSQLGRLPCLVAGIVLAVSPTAVYASRQVSGLTLVLLGAMLFVAGLTHYLNSFQRRWLYMAAAASATSLCAGPQMYTILVSWIVSCAALITLFGSTTAERVGEGFRRLLPKASWMAPLMLGSVVALSTGLGWNPGGLSAAGQLFIEWGERFARSLQGGISPFLLLFVYEPLGFLLGIVGSVTALREQRTFGKFLVTWSLSSFLVLVLAPGAEPSEVCVVLLPLSLLCGMAVKSCVLGLRHRARFGALELGYAGFVLALCGHIYLALVHSQGTAGSATDLLLALFAFILLPLTGLLFAVIRSPAHARGTVVTVVCTCLLLLSLSTARRLAFDPRTQAVELLASKPVVLRGVRHLAEAVHDILWKNSADGDTQVLLDETAALDPILRWYLRESVDPYMSAAEIETPLLIVSSDQNPPRETFDETYTGTHFPISARWYPTSLGIKLEWPPDLSSALGWFLLRKPGDSMPVVEQTVSLWTRTPD